ncbi:phosphoglycerate mutase-like protein [Epithele typhae]|uniref:phosphoglycerate mutase-like protein n=1 Tax=Epithele typhae TaxID=378194 RepID=UPI002007A4F3|nr:phosphoglycerate mutase-like protein [Epithele typhae]KAH9921572.1 phosphoglycerate mutase-like protein [Epithele typhae]
MAPATEKRIYLTRHAEAEHNVSSDWYIPDAPLTPLGRTQAASLHAATLDTVQADAALLVTSGLRRTLSTTVVGYATLRARLEAAGTPVAVLPQLQEANDLPCDTGSPRETLEADPEYAGLDFAQLTPDWTSKAGFYASSPAALAARARWVRAWLRARPEPRIALVAHGDFLRWLVHGRNDHAPWANVEVREYTFAAEDDEDARLVPVARLVADPAGDAPTSSSNA